MKVYQFKNLLKIEKSNNWELKILKYADMRVGPFGVVSLEARLGEVINRLLEGEKDKWLGHIEASKRIEKEIQKNVDVNLQEITENSLEKKDFSSLEI
jgi:hypothetical protein